MPTITLPCTTPHRPPSGPGPPPPGPGSRPPGGPVDNPGTAFRRWATLPTGGSPPAAGAVGCPGGRGGGGRVGRGGETSCVLDACGRAVAAWHGPEDRTSVRLENVSRWMRLAVVDSED